MDSPWRKRKGKRNRKRKRNRRGNDYGVERGKLRLESELISGEHK